jgi:hypothetical protein
MIDKNLLAKAQATLYRRYIECNRKLRAKRKMELCSHCQVLMPDTSKYTKEELEALEE